MSPYRRFAAHFGGEPTTIEEAPGRVNLIGEHTDYNDGFVMPVAIDRQTTAAITPRRDRLLIVRSAAHEDVATIDAPHLRAYVPAGSAERLRTLVGSLRLHS